MDLLAYCEENKIKKIAVRPHVTLKSLQNEKDFHAIDHFGEFIAGPHKYPSFAVKQQICSNAYFRGDLKIVIVVNLIFFI